MKRAGRQARQSSLMAPSPRQQAPGTGRGRERRSHTHPARSIPPAHNRPPPSRHPSTPPCIVPCISVGSTAPDTLAQRLPAGSQGMLLKVCLFPRQASGLGASDRQHSPPMLWGEPGSAHRPSCHPNAAGQRAPRPLSRAIRLCSVREGEHSSTSLPGWGQPRCNESPALLKKGGLLPQPRTPGLDAADPLPARLTARRHTPRSHLQPFPSARTLRSRLH